MYENPIVYAHYLKHFLKHKVPYDFVTLNDYGENIYLFI